MSDPGVVRDGRTWGTGARVLAAAIGVASVAMAVDLLNRAGEPVEVITAPTLAIAIGASLIALGGAITMGATRHGDVAVLAFVTSMLLLMAVALTIFGVLVLPLVIAVVIVIVRRVAGRHGIAVALLAGPATAVGIAMILVIWVQPPVVDCLADGVRVTSRPWWSSDSGSGESGTAVSGVAMSTGLIDTPAGEFEYTCRGDRLVEFRRT